MLGERPVSWLSFGEKRCDVEEETDEREQCSFEMECCRGYRPLKLRDDEAVDEVEGGRIGSREGLKSVTLSEGDRVDR